MDSFGIIETVMFLERNFGVEIARADISGEHFENVTSLAEFVAKRLTE